MAAALGLAALGFAGAAAAQPDLPADPSSDSFTSSSLAASPGSVDPGANDTGANDTGANDTGANDTGANDTEANDTGANDTRTNDIGAASTSGTEAHGVTFGRAVLSPALACPDPEEATSRSVGPGVSKTES